MRILLALLAFVLATAPASAQNDPRFSISTRDMRDGTGARVGTIFEASNNTDAPLCLEVRSYIRDNVRGGIVAPTIALAPRQQRVRIASFMIRFARDDAQGGVMARVVENCEES